VIDWSVSPRASQLAQLLILGAVAMLIGGRFLPPRYRQRAGVAVTLCYLAGIAAFLVYLLLH
jgi:hypothetical protein